MWRQREVSSVDSKKNEAAEVTTMIGFSVQKQATEAISNKPWKKAATSGGSEQEQSTVTSNN